MISNHHPLLFLTMGHRGIPVPCGCHGNQPCHQTVYYLTVYIYFCRNYSCMNNNMSQQRLKMFQACRVSINQSTTIAIDNLCPSLGWPHWKYHERDFVMQTSPMFKWLLWLPLSRRTQPNPTLFDVKSPPLRLSHDGSAGVSLSSVVAMAIETMQNIYFFLNVRWKNNILKVFQC